MMQISIKTLAKLLIAGRVNQGVNVITSEINDDQGVEAFFFFFLVEIHGFKIYDK